ncbi:hypothetical protein PHYSODRAFT_259497 [Phytophthora sojae]|uniref:Uncharacterized protein n=1 Tax=Phytophthora sojae (strain P6497) TaxID=1094619 RepID=G4Z647_PHYSP|nr:hypothetical protein PHYSODRAFT_259497 [Phytophthora sojae]EGZ20968.1 hypothetical protein PHYSODRAFT_259497 [Phytophthora sojae]|eukprot:XP_009523685.1 hypothetical protein PHYSODRAFT_259497 [Phytophthora sojae]
MEKNGIKHRKHRDVYFQIYNLMRRFEPVKKWLEAQGQLQLFCRGELIKQVEAQMQRRYTHFRELRPVFDHDGYDTASDEEGEDGDEEADQGSSDEDEYHPTKGASPVDRLPWESEDGDDDYDVTNATPTGNAGHGNEVELKLAAIRLQEGERREKLRTEAEEMRTKAEKLLLRHKMKREGISDEEINSAIPM